jgi:hypothetical protein
MDALTLLSSPVCSPSCQPKPSLTQISTTPQTAGQFSAWANRWNEIPNLVVRFCGHMLGRHLSRSQIQKNNLANSLNNLPRFFSARRLTPC